mgnify:CR=1 FL=1
MPYLCAYEGQIYYGMTIDGLLTNAKTLKRDMDSGRLARNVLMRHGDDIVEQQRVQLFMGKGSDGKDLHPFYSEDIKPKGWFLTKESARRYADWKQTISYPYTVKRKPDVPNLYITGVFHDDLNVEFGSDSLAIVPDTAYAANIMRKYGMNVFGLSMLSWGIIWNDNGAKDELITKMRETIWQ